VKDHHNLAFGIPVADVSVQKTNVTEREGFMGRREHGVPEVDDDIRFL
jgi:hypothetical protein